MIKTFKIIACLVLTSILFGACDANIPTEALLTPDNSVAVADFTTSESSVTLGNSVLLSWELEIEDGVKVDFITIEPDGGQSTSASGSVQVTPSETTQYTLTAFVNNEAAASRSLTITVITADGDEVVEAPDAEDCTDNEDNDLDGAVDCDDSDCAESANCVETEIEYSLETAYALADGSGGTIYIGDAVTVTWLSNYRYTTVTGYDGYYGATSSITVTAAAENSYTINAFDSDAQFVQSFDVTFTAGERPVEEDHSVFEASVSAKANPSTVIWGESFWFSYKATKAARVYLKYGSYDYQEVHEQGDSFEFELTDYIIDGSITFSLYAVDQYGNSNESEPVTLKVTPVKISDGKSSIMSGITKMVYTYKDGEYYFISKSKIWHTVDYGKTIEPLTVSGVVGDYTTVATDKDDVLYLAVAKSVTTDSPDGTGGGLYFSTDKTTFTKMDPSPYVKVIYPRDINTVYIGTDKIWFKIYAETAATCSSGSVKTGNYCADWGDFDGRESDADWDQEEEQINFQEIYVRQTGDKKAMLVAGDVTYVTTDGGDSFTQISSAISGAFWHNSHSAFAWNKSASLAYTYDSKAGAFEGLAISSTQYDIAGMNYITELNGHTFIATDEGIFYEDDEEWLSLDVSVDAEDPIVYMIGASVTAEGSTASSKTRINFAAGKTYTLRGITAAGKIYTLEWTAKNANLTPTISTGSFGFDVGSLND